MAYGEIRFNSGAFTSNADSVEITFKGRGAHGSAPDKSIDPVIVAARFIVDVQSVISREKDSARFGVVTIGSVQAGNAGNVIPDTATLRGTIRSYDNDTRLKMLSDVPVPGPVIRPPAALAGTR